MTRKALTALLALPLVLLLLGLSAPVVNAGTASDTMDVTATVVTVCDFSASDVAFGQYTGQALTGTSYWVGKCSTSQAPISYYSWNSGLHASATPNMQRVGESDLLGYNWTTYSLTFVTDATGTVGGTMNWEVPAGQIVPAGDYADTVTVSMGF